MKTIFEPLRPETWYFILIFVIPTLGFAVWLNEYGHTGSVFPKTETVVELFVDDYDTQRVNITECHVPICKSILKAVYSTGFSVFSGTYGSPIVSVGGKLSLLGLSLELLTLVAVYTANLLTLLVRGRSSLW
jgi:hypothetical protein